MGLRAMKRGFFLRVYRAFRRLRQEQSIEDANDEAGPTVTRSMGHEPKEMLEANAPKKSQLLTAKKIAPFEAPVSLKNVRKESISNTDRELMSARRCQHCNRTIIPPPSSCASMPIRITRCPCGAVIHLDQKPNVVVAPVKKKA